MTRLEGFLLDWIVGRVVRREQIARLRQVAAEQEESLRQIREAVERAGADEARMRAAVSAAALRVAA